MSFFFFSYLFLALLFIHRYFNPKKWSEWLVNNAKSYYQIYIITLLLIVLPLSLLSSVEWMYTIPLLLIALAGVVLIIKNRVNALAGRSLFLLLPFALYLTTILQEVYLSYSSSDPYSFDALFIWYLLGIVTIPIGGKILGILLGVLFPKTTAKHNSIMKNKIKRKILASASDFIGLILIYCLWMSLRVAFMPEILDMINSLW